ncbi:MAG: hypothetical protein AAGC92_14290 [Pseudomonadota bacterium]
MTAIVSITTFRGIGLHGRLAVQAPEWPVMSSEQLVTAGSGSKALSAYLASGAGLLRICAISASIRYAINKDATTDTVGSNSPILPVGGVEYIDLKPGGASQLRVAIEEI